MDALSPREPDEDDEGAQKLKPLSDEIQGAQRELLLIVRDLYERSGLTLEVMARTLRKSGSHVSHMLAGRRRLQREAVEQVRQYYAAKADRPGSRLEPLSQERTEKIEALWQSLEGEKRLLVRAGELRETRRQLQEAEEQAAKALGLAQSSDERLQDNIVELTRATIGLKQLSEEVERASSRVYDLQERLTDKEQYIADLRDELAEERGAWAAEEAKTRAKLREHHETVQRLHAQITALTDQVETLKMEKATAERVLRAAELEHEHHQQQWMAAAEGLRRQTAREREALARQVDQHKEELASERDRRLMAEVEMARLQQQLAETLDRMEHAESTVAAGSGESTPASTTATASADPSLHGYEREIPPAVIALADQVKAAHDTGDTSWVDRLLSVGGDAAADEIPVLISYLRQEGMLQEAHTLLVGAGQRRSASEVASVVDAFRRTSGMARVDGESDAREVIRACALRTTSDLISVLRQLSGARRDLSTAVLQAAAQHRYPGTIPQLISELELAGRHEDAEDIRRYRH
ncbi:helix-turn-helix domain-containing protein [Streptomyces sp. NPDC041068]|uniref:helix-turn-helix domain-containing protein n=1 Tax=Streptomyces sp. NPDC041068 TaxID=3155130 RepID=UPI0033E1049C